MGQRHTHVIGDYLMVDDVTGVVYYASQMTQDWDGTWRHSPHLDGQHPDFLRRTWPREESPLYVTGGVAYPDLSDLTLPTVVGGTTVPRRRSPADVIFE